MKRYMKHGFVFALLASFLMPTVSIAADNGWRSWFLRGLGNYWQQYARWSAENKSLNRYLVLAGGTAAAAFSAYWLLKSKKASRVVDRDISINGDFLQAKETREGVVISIPTSPSEYASHWAILVGPTEADDTLFVEAADTRPGKRIKHLITIRLLRSSPGMVEVVDQRKSRHDGSSQDTQTIFNTQRGLLSLKRQRAEKSEKVFRKLPDGTTEIILPYAK